MKHKHISKKFWKNQVTPMQKAADSMNSYDDIINISIGDSDFTTDERIIKLSMADALAGHTKYTHPQGDPELIDEIKKYYKEEYNQNITKQEIFVTTSSCLGMELVMISILDSGDEVIVFSPYFTPYKQQIELAGGIAVEVPTYESEGFGINEQRLNDAITERTKAIIFNNPCNPTGAAYGHESQEIIAKAAKKYDLVVVADEIYTFYMYKESFVPIRSIVDMDKRTITLNSFSKNYMMAGWRIGYIVAEPHFIEVLQSVNENMVYTAPSISQRGAIHALRLRESIKEKYINEYKKRVFYATERINKIPFLSVREPEGTFYLFVNIQKTGLSSQKFCEKLLNDAHIVAIPGIAFGSAGEGYIRIACTMGLDGMEKAFDRIEKLVF